MKPIVERARESLQALNAELISPTHDLRQANQQWALFSVLLLCCLSLFLVNYAMRSDVLVSAWDGLYRHGWLSRESWQAFYQSHYRDLLLQLWWGSVIVVGYIVLPLLYLRSQGALSLSELGVQWGRLADHPWRYGLLGVALAGLAFAGSYTETFSKYYPFYRLASRSWLDLLLWECIYVLQFVAVEFFFRGFLLRRLTPYLGLAAIAVMVVPYTMIHFPKPALEAVGAIPFGLLLGYLALQSRSIWGGVFLHVALAVTMDITALLQGAGMPQVWR